MKISLSWIKNYVTPGVSVEQLVRRLTMAGIEAEKIEKAGSDPLRRGRAEADTVIEFEITPNRPDCLNMIGMAREISAALNKPLTLPKIRKRKFPKTKCDVSILAPEACSRYIGTVIEGVEIKKAAQTAKPRQSCLAWLENLESLGNRLINNVVDVTNFCLFEMGQPLHAFDLDKLKGGKIVVRFAGKGEKIITLDGVERELDPGILVIADAERPVALAGIMGGASTEVTAKTKNILLESACFNPVLIRRTARKFGLSSDSSYRFERGVVYENVEAGANRAVDLILESAGGEVTQRTDVKAGKKPTAPKAIAFDQSKMNNFLGANIPLAETKRILKALGFSTASAKKGVLKVTPPFFRSDIKRPVDLYEEIARVVGYDNLPSSFPVIKITGMRSGGNRGKRLRIVDHLLSQGFNETLTYSMLSKDLMEKAKVDGCSRMDILNPLSKEQEMMRPALLPSLLQVAHTNINRGQKDLAFFEAGKIYPHGGEKETLGILMTGRLRRDWRDTTSKPVDFFDLKGPVEKMLFQLGAGRTEFRVSSEGFLEEGQRADIFIGKKKIGVCGKAADDVLQVFGIKETEVFFAQLDLESIYALPVKKTKYVPICEYPAITRDVSLAIAKDVDFEKVCAVVKEFGTEHLTRIELKEEYLGEKIEKDRRGLVFSVVYQSSKGTLTEDDVQPAHEIVCQKIVERLGAAIR